MYKYNNYVMFTQKCTHPWDTTIPMGRGRLILGGFGTGSYPPIDSMVIDLTGEALPIVAYGKGFSHTQSSLGDWLSLPIRDYGIPHWGRNTWAVITQDIHAQLESGGDVAIGCQGSHGRTGLAVAIIAGILQQDYGYDLDALPNPVAWVRKVHCTSAVETDKQVGYVFDTLDLENPYSTRPRITSTHTPYDACQLCGDLAWLKTPCIDCGYAMCAECREETQIGGSCIVCQYSTHTNQHTQTHCDLCLIKDAVDVCPECGDRMCNYCAVQEVQSDDWVCVDCLPVRAQARNSVTDWHNTHN